MWSKCPCVANAATGRLPSASSIAWTRSGENPGSTTTASSVPSVPSSQQLVSNELSEKTSRYMEGESIERHVDPFRRRWPAIRAGSGP